MSVLLLNSDAQPINLLPLSTIGWQDAVKSYFQDKVKIIKSYENRILHSADFEMEMPSIVILNRYHKQPDRAKLSRRTLFIRDDYRCQYCGVKFYHHELTFDHVLPKAYGGKSSWTNMVASCKPCNTKKGCRQDIQPMKPPVRPSWRQIYNQSKCYKITIPDPAWQDFLSWPEELVHITQKYIQ